MENPERLATYVHEALAAGQSSEKTRATLEGMGWTAPEIDKAFEQVASAEALPAPPRPSKRFSAQDTALYLLQFIALLVSALSLQNLLSGVVHIQLLDPENPPDTIRWATDGIRSSLASLAVVMPFYIWILRRTNAHSTLRKHRSSARHWMLFTVNILAVIWFLGQAIRLIAQTLGGDLSLIIVLQAASAFLISGAILLYHLVLMGEQHHG